MNTYKTIDIARIIGIHVNTVRLYEKCGLIPKPERLENAYRVFTDLHIECMDTGLKMAGRSSMKNRPPRCGIFFRTIFPAWRLCLPLRR